MLQNSAVLNLKLHYRLHKSPLVAQFLKEKESSPQTPAIFMKVPFEYYLPTSSNGLFRSDVQRKPFNATIISPTHATRLGHPISSQYLVKGKTCNIPYYQGEQNERPGLYL